MPERLYLKSISCLPSVQTCIKDGSRPSHFIRVKYFLDIMSCCGRVCGHDRRWIRITPETLRVTLCDVDEKDTHWWIEDDSNT